MRRLLFLAFATITLFQAAYAAQDLPTIESAGLKDPKEIIDRQLSSLARLSAMTKKTLESLNELSTGISNYHKVQEIYLNNPKDKEVLFKMAKMAAILLKKIKSAHLQHAIDPEFLKELKLFEKIYQKNELQIE